MMLKSTVLFFIFHVMYACEKYAFKAKEDIELRDHVITTMTTPYVELCWSKCVWIMNCFTINVRVNSFGMIECDLNNSSKKASPGSMVQRQGSQYHQMRRVNGCQLYECKAKKVLGEGWFRYNGEDLKMFIDNKTWIDARAHCMSLGGDLLSIETQYQSDFFHEVIKMTPTNTSWHEPKPWIGYNAINSSLGYKWSDGRRSSFSPLLPGWNISVQKCVAFKNGKQWFATDCDEKREYFCAKPYVS